MSASPGFETVASFTRLEEAQGARAVLAGAGLAPVLLDEMTSSIDWGLLPALGGIRLEVPVEQAARAREILAELQDTDHEPTPEERAWLEESRWHKRGVALLALAILLLPILVVLLTRFL